MIDVCCKCMSKSFALSAYYLFEQLFVQLIDQQAVLFSLLFQLHTSDFQNVQCPLPTAP